MSKKAPKERLGKTDQEERVRQSIRQLDTGDGIEATVGIGDNLYHFTNRVPSLQSKSLHLEVEVSSSRSEDDDLLAFLSQRTQH